MPIIEVKDLVKIYKIIEKENEVFIIVKAIKDFFNNIT